MRKFALVSALYIFGTIPALTALAIFVYYKLFVVTGELVGNETALTLEDAPWETAMLTAGGVSAALWLTVNIQKAVMLGIRRIGRRLDDDKKQAGRA